MCTNCKNNCLEEHADKCILYTGPDFEKFGIKNGEYYDKIIVDLLNQLQEICDETVELSCIYTGECDNCDTEVKIPKAVELIIDKICKLTSSDIKYDGHKYCIGDTSISSGAIHLLGRSFRYNVSPANTGSAVSYDLTDVIKSLPADYRVGRINTVISGTPKRGKSVILDSDKAAVGATIGNDRFPINLDIDMRVNTPSGDVKMVKRLSIPSPQSGSYVGQFNVQDFGTDLQPEFSLESFIESMAAQVCANKTELDSYKNMDLPGCSHFSYGSMDIRDILAQQSALICSILDRLERLENITISVQKDDCGVKTYTGTPEEVSNQLATICSGLRNDVNGLSRDVQTLRDVQSTNSGSNGEGGIITNGGTIGGGCTSGNCGQTTPTNGNPIITTGRCPGGNCGT